MCIENLYEVEWSIALGLDPLPRHFYSEKHVGFSTVQHPFDSDLGTKFHRLREASDEGALPFQDIDFAGFKIFMDLFLETETPDDLVKHLFLSFVQSPHKALADGKTLKVRRKE